jgi:hypothetical protein
MAKQPSDSLLSDHGFRVWWWFYSRWIDWRCRRVGHTTKHGLERWDRGGEWLCGRCGEPFMPSGQ